MIQALGSRVLLKLAPREKKHGSIIIPEAHAEAPIWGEVVNCGEECVKEICEGNKVYFMRHSGAKIPVAHDPDSEYILIDESDIYAKEV